MEGTEVYAHSVSEDRQPNEYGDTECSPVDPNGLLVNGGRPNADSGRLDRRQERFAHRLRAPPSYHFL